MKVLTSQEVSELLRMPHWSVLKAFREDNIPGRKIGRYWFTTEEALEQHIRGEVVELPRPAVILRAAS